MYGELATAEAEIQVLDPVHFYWSVSTSKELRNASNQTDTLIRNFLVECEMRVDVFIAKKNADANIESQGVNLSAEERRLGEKMKLDGKRAGLDLPEGKRKVLELNRLCVGFSRGAFIDSIYFAVGVYRTGPFWRRIVDRRGPRPLLACRILQNMLFLQ